jgi:CelD/BcsL family acetyltransferase involved in cellulose biosynthesis
MIPHRREALGLNRSIRAVLVWQQTRLVGIAPYYVQSHIGQYAEYRLLGSPAHRIGPLAAPGLLAPVCSAIVEGLSRVDPTPSVIRLEGVDAGDNWAATLARTWSGEKRPFVRKESSLAAPVVNLTAPSYTAWLSAKSSNFRQSTRRLRRGLASEGATFRMTSRPADLDSDVDKLIALHTARWEGRGGSAALKTGISELLKAVGRELLPQERFRLWLLEVDGDPVAAQLFLVAGGETAYWNGGFDQRFARSSPAFLTLLAALEDSFARGESRLDLRRLCGTPSCPETQAICWHDRAHGRRMLECVLAKRYGIGYPTESATRLKRRWATSVFARAISSRLRLTGPGRCISTWTSRLGANPSNNAQV